MSVETAKRYTKDELFKSSMRALTNLAATLLIDFDPNMSPPDLKAFLVDRIMVEQAKAALHTPLVADEDKGEVAVGSSGTNVLSETGTLTEAELKAGRDKLIAEQAKTPNGLEEDNDVRYIPDEILGALKRRLGYGTLHDRITALEQDSSNRIKTLEKAVSDLQSEARQKKALHGSIDDLGKVEHLKA